jgi:hypothetical protein
MSYNKYIYQYTQEEQSDVKRFQQRFEAHITESREYRHSIRAPIDYMTLKHTATYEMEHKVEPCVAIHLPQHQFDRLMDDQTRMDRLREDAEAGKRMWVKDRADRSIRETNPTVEKAYQKYLMLLELCRT